MIVSRFPELRCFTYKLSLGKHIYYLWLLITFLNILAIIAHGLCTLMRNCRKFKKMTKIFKWLYNINCNPQSSFVSFGRKKKELMTNIKWRNLNSKIKILCETTTWFPFHIITHILNSMRYISLYLRRTSFLILGVPS